MEIKKEKLLEFRLGLKQSPPKAEVVGWKVATIFYRTIHI